ncbi:MAG: 30S ribosomal protein S24e [Thermoprotei archaeon]|nr:MAG: 30S ribosomal protein S24e [Thermoprotei archaeon]
MSVRSNEEERGKRFVIGENVEGYVVRERYNKLVGRRELEVVIDHMFKGTPKRSEMREALAKLYGVSTDLVIVKRILSEYGWGKSRARVHIYDNIERLKAFEPKHILRRHGLEGG